MSKAFRRLSVLFTLAFLVALAPVAVLAEEPAAPATSTADDYQGPRLLPDCKAPFQLPGDARRSVGDSVLLFQAVVLKDGTIGYAELLNDDRPYPGVEQAARDSFRRWRYAPGTLGGEAVEAGVTISVQFRGGAAAAATRPAETWNMKAGATFPGLDQIILRDGLRSSGHSGKNWEHNTTTVQSVPKCEFTAGPFCGHSFNQPPHNESGAPGAQRSRSGK
jgi:hypothetical protein